MKKSIFLLKLIGIAILIIILSKIDFSLIWLRIRNCNLYFLCAAIFSQLAVLGVRVIRWRYILGLLKIKVSFSNALRAFWAGLYLAAITPGKLGEISRVYFITKNNPSIARPIFSVFIDRLTDVISLLLFGILASFFYLSELQQLNKLLILILVGLGLCIWVIFLKRDFFYALFKKLLYRLFSKEKITLNEDLDLRFLERLKASNYLVLFFYILLGWFVFFFGWWLLAKALYINISFLKIILTVSIATVVSAIPISIAGLGTRDATVVFLFSKMGIMKEATISFSLLIFAIEIVIVCAGILFLWQGVALRAALKNNDKIKY